MHLAPARIGLGHSDRSNQRLSAFRIAAPPRAMPAKISALALATPVSPSGKFSICTGPTVVIATACGSTMRDSGSISSAWFMPISNTPAPGRRAASAPGSGARRCGCCRILTEAWARPGQRQAGAHGLGDAGLADGAGHRAAPRQRRALAGRDAHLFQAPSACRRRGCAIDRRPRRASGQGAGRALAQGLFDELMPVPLAGQGDEQVAGREGAGVDGDAGRGERPRQGAATGGGGDLASRGSVHNGSGMDRLQPQRRAGLGQVVEGNGAVAHRLPLLMALAGDHQKVAARASMAAAALIASRRSPISLGASGDEARIAARMAAGISERGLSSVTMTTSASRAATSPMIGRLPRSRRRRAEDHDQAPHRMWGRSALRMVSQSVGRMGIVDIGLAAARPRPDMLQPPRRAFDMFKRAQHRFDSLAGCDAETGGDQRVRGLERPRERQR